MASPILSPLFTMIYNESINTGIVPDILKYLELHQFLRVKRQRIQITIDLYQHYPHLQKYWND
jgi:hypothetical protein